MDFKEVISVHYQPIVKYSKEASSVIDDTWKQVFDVVKLEALAYSNTENTLGRKLQIIEDNNLSFELFKYIFNTILDDFPKIQENFWDDTEISVNISPNDIASIDLTAFMATKLWKNDFDFSKITIEILESELDKKKKWFFLSNLKYLKKNRIKISQDDFWSEFSKQNRYKYLSEKKVLDYLKFDWDTFKYIVEGTWNVFYKEFLEELEQNKDLKLIFEHIENKRMLEKTLKMFPDFDKYFLQWNIISEKKSLKELLKMNKKIIV